jgi:hypothetical protein
MTTATSQALTDAGLIYPGARVCESEPHELLQWLARDHAKYQAAKRRQGHQRFQERFDAIYKALGLYAVEIAAESWDRQRNDPLPEIGKEMFRCWEQSPGHWRVASARHKYFGADMAQGSNGVWYACILAADESNPRGVLGMGINWSLLSKLVDLVRAAPPFPNFTDEAAVTAWLDRLKPAEAAVIVAAVSQFKAQGAVVLSLPDGEMLTVARKKDGCDGWDCCVTEADAAKICSADPEAFGDGKWLEIIQKIIALLPGILAIFSLFSTNDEPAPSPDPEPPINV